MRKFIALVAGVVFASVALATEVVLITPASAPTLSEVGIGALVVVMAAAAGWVLRKRK